MSDPERPKQGQTYTDGRVAEVALVLTHVMFGDIAADTADKQIRKMFRTDTQEDRSEINDQMDYLYRTRKP